MPQPVILPDTVGYIRVIFITQIKFAKAVFRVGLNFICISPPNF